MFTPEGEASPIKPLSLAEYDFDKAVGFFDDAKALREKELLQQFENGKVREEYRQLLKEGKMTFEELQAVLEGKKSEVVREVIEKKFALSGNNLDNSGDEGYNKDTIDSVSYEKRYNELSEEELKLYSKAKKGDTESAFKLINGLIGATKTSGINFSKLDKDVFLLPIVGVDGTSNNILPTYIAKHLSNSYGLNAFKGIYKSKESDSRNLSAWKRMKENYPSFEMGQNSDSSTIKGKKFFLIDDNSTTGRTFVGLKNFIEENGGIVEGYYALTVGQDASEKMTVNEKTWNEAIEIGIDSLEKFAKEEGVKREISRQGLTERECQELIRRWNERQNNLSGGRTKNDRRGKSEAQGVPPISSRNGEEGAVQEGQIVNKSTDAEYLELAKNPEKNEARLREMVEKAAKKAGYNSPLLYHGAKGFISNRFDKTLLFTVDNPDVAKTYVGRDGKAAGDGIREFYGDTDDFLVIDAMGSNWNDIPFIPDELSELLGEQKQLESELSQKTKEVKAYAKEHGIDFSEAEFKVKGYSELYDKVEEIYKRADKAWEDSGLNGEISTNAIAEYAKRVGYKDVTIKNVVDIGANADNDDSVKANVSIFFNPQAQVKSADLVTYDNEGNVIPISERFNTEKNDTRHSLDDTGVYSLEDAWAEMTKKYGAIPKGEKAARDIKVPKKISDNKLDCVHSNVCNFIFSSSLFKNPKFPLTFLS